MDLDLAVLQKSLGDRNWSLFATVIIGGLVRFSKTPMAGQLFNKIPRKYRTFLPVALGILSGIGEALVKGTPWGTAIIYGILSGMLAIGGHEIINAPTKQE